MEKRAKVKERNGRKGHDDARDDERNGGSGKPESIRVTSLPYVQQECAGDSLVNLSSKHIVRA